MTDGLVFMIINASPNPVLSNIPVCCQYLSNSHHTTDILSRIDVIVQLQAYQHRHQ